MAVNDDKEKLFANRYNAVTYFKFILRIHKNTQTQVYINKYLYVHIQQTSADKCIGIFYLDFCELL